MNAATFLERRRPIWDRLGRLVARCGRRGVAALSEEELRQLTRLYPAVAVDVARARMYRLAPATQQEINRVAIAAHGLLYRKPQRRAMPAVGRFLFREYPALFRRMWLYVALSVALFAVGALGAYACVQLRPATAYLFVPGEIDLVDNQRGVSAADISERFRRIPNPPLAAGVMTNNLGVAFMAFALGITAGIGTGYLLFYNALMLGAFAGHFDVHGLAYPFWCFIVPHGALEIFAILVAGAAGLRLGLSLAVPGELTRGASLRRGAREAVYLLLGTAPMFVIAGLIEGFVTPSEFPGEVKLLIGILTAGAVITHLLLSGRRSAAAPPVG